MAYEAESAPPLPNHPHSPHQDTQSPASPPQPQRLPPPPPQKIPLDYNEEPQAPKAVPRRPQYDPEHSYDGSRPQSPQKLKRPQFDPQNSHDTRAGSSHSESQGQRPKIPTPHFTSFNVESALPLVQSPHKPSMPSQQMQAQSTIISHDNDSDRHHADQHLHQPSITSIGPNSDGDRWIAGLKPWESHLSYVPSPEQQHAVSSHDGQSTSTTDLSSNTAGKSTPESQQTSNTSYREGENPVDKSRHGQQSDDSFYWHSGRSSSEADGEHSQVGSPTATPGESIMDSRSSATNSTAIPSNHQALPSRSTSLSPAPGVPYGASALGFGGPSDWEYFGDYEAEEIDDEELYSRPRPRDSANVKDRSAELPGDSLATENGKQQNESEWRDPKLDFGETPALPERSPPRQPKVSPSQEHVKSDLVPSGAQVPADLSPDQRPELDDVIRAWSEAPYVGKDTTSGQESAGVSDEPPDVAEASLASTPQERMLGVDVILRDAPSLPKLPASLEQANASEAQSEVLMTDAVVQSNHKENKEQLVYNPKQLQNLNGISESPGITPGKDEHHNQENTNSYQRPQSLYTSADEESSSLQPHQSHPKKPHTGSISMQEPAVGNKINLEVMEEPDIATRRSSAMTLVDAYTNLTPRKISQDNTDQVSKEDVPINKQSSAQIAILDKTREDLAKAQQEPSRASPEISRSASPETSQAMPPDIEKGTTQKALTETLETNLQQPEQEELRNDQSKTVQNQSAEDLKKTSRIVQSVEGQTQESDAVGESPQEKVTAPSVVPPPIQRPTPQTAKLVDPYADLDPWGKASLNRFAAMLREEARAESNKDKLNIFNVFTSRESRLRVVLYGTDEELVVSQKPAEQKAEVKPKPEKTGFVKQAVQRANTMDLQRSLKALPALPANRDSVIGLPGNTLAPLMIQDNSNPKAKAAEDSPTDGPQYSPGGRPIISRPHGANLESKRGSTLHTRTSSIQDNFSHSPSSDAPITPGSDDVGLSNKHSYTPIRPNEGRSEVKNYLANRKSVCRPYATLTQGSFESGSNFGREPDLPNSNANAPIPAPTSQYNPNLQTKADHAPDAMDKQKATGAEAQPDLRRFVKADFDPLVLALPESEATIHESARLEDLKNVMEAIQDDFSFIHQSVVAWDAKAKKQREENDRQRHARQIESEQRIDSLFDDHEIGYGDISELEAEFKQSEAARRADEDRSEYQTFVSDVFNIVWTRLHYELDQLIPHYERYSKLMNDTLAGKDMFEASKDGLALAPTMSSFLGLHQKLEIRHQKAFEAVLERDRRLKKTEISPWYTLSNIAKVKQLEKQFEDAEKKAIIEYCQQRDTRANRLMDVLDQNTLRGVGANQDYMEAIMKAVRRIASGRAFASVPGSNEPTAGLEEVEKAKNVTGLLATSSEQIVQTFHVADMLLNSADYELSLAKSKVARADTATLNKLKEERMKEDQKLMRDLEHRLALIREDSRRTNDEIVKLMLFLGVQNGRADSTPLQAGPADPGHEARIQKALEEAKKRNALKESGG